jgi:hypothetical protein
MEKTNDEKRMQVRSQRLKLEEKLKKMGYDIDDLVADSPFNQWMEEWLDD